MLNMNSFREYCEFLRRPSGRSGLSDLIDALSTCCKPFQVGSAARSSGEKPCSVAMILRSLAQLGSRKVMEALELGAVDVPAKPQGSFSLGETGQSRTAAPG